MSALRPAPCHTPGPGADWPELDAVTLNTTPQFYPDRSEPLPSCRFYRAWQTNVPSRQPALQLTSLTTEITLTGAIGSSVRIDYIKPVGPTDAWLTLDTVTLTNATQPYFDFTMFRRPARAIPPRSGALAGGLTRNGARWSRGRQRECVSRGEGRDLGKECRHYRPKLV